jgi:23S rRNA (adenine2503-C2)-methyltransferase
MEIVSRYGKESIAYVYIGKTSSGKLVEFVESVQEGIPREKKWVLIISTMDGCPVKCKFCDAGGYYKGNLTVDDMLDQINFLVSTRYQDQKIPCEKWKIQFARLGEPSLNDAVLDVLEKLPNLFHSNGLLPSLSTVAPIKREKFFDRLLDIKNQYFLNHFQLQFSIHSTSDDQRKELIPISKWTFHEISKYGEKFVSNQDKKISLNFAISKDSMIDPKILLEYFNPRLFLIKITPVNPTYASLLHGFENGLNLETSYLPYHPFLVEELKSFGFEVILSIGNLEENDIGSNCGQYLRKHMESKQELKKGYSYVPSNR